MRSAESDLWNESLSDCERRTWAEWHNYLGIFFFCYVILECGKCVWLLVPAGDGINELAFHSFERGLFVFFFVFLADCRWFM